MLKFAASIRFRIWLLFIGFVFWMLGFLFVNQIVLFPTFYTLVKTKEAVTTANTLKTIWDNDAELQKEIYSYAKKQEMFVEAEVLDSEKDTKVIYTEDPEGRYERLREGNRVPDNIFFEDLLSSKTGTVIINHTKTEGERSYLVLMTYVGTKQDVKGYILILNYLQPLDNTKEVLESQFFLNATILMLVAFLLSSLIVTTISAPIVRISEKAQKLSTGDFRMDIKKGDYAEIKMLTENLNQVSVEIAKTEDLRRDLIANVSHDLKTPLTMIKAYAEMIRDISGNSAEKREKHLKVIIDEVERLNCLVVDMLDLSKLQSGVIEKVVSDFNFSEHLKELINRLEYFAKARGNYEVIPEIEENIFISADITKIEQVVYNLVNNAISYTGDDGVVKARLFRKTDSVARFEVTDTGVGIPEEDLPYIWNRYYRAEGSQFHKRAIAGTGLGLSIVKNVLEMHYFSYGADSQYGSGSTFWFEFKTI